MIFIKSHIMADKAPLILLDFNILYILNDFLMDKKISYFYINITKYI